MIKGTTPTHTFTLPFDTSMVEKVRIIYAQGENVVLVKETKDCNLDGMEVRTTLTQQDTFNFDDCDCVQVQIRVLTKGGDALASVIKRVGVSQVLDDEVL